MVPDMAIDKVSVLTCCIQDRSLSGRRRLRGLPVAILLCCGISACGTTDRAGVSGTVSLDGELLQSGEITFSPTEGAVGPTAGSPIQNGRFEILAIKGAAIGRNRVTINSRQKTGRKIQSVDSVQDEYAEAVPSKYNAQSELIYDLKPGKNELNIELRGRISIETARPTN